MKIVLVHGDVGTIGVPKKLCTGLEEIGGKILLMEEPRFPSRLSQTPEASQMWGANWPGGLTDPSCPGEEDERRQISKSQFVSLWLALGRQPLIACHHSDPEVHLWRFLPAESFPKLTTDTTLGKTQSSYCDLVHIPCLEIFLPLLGLSSI